MVPLWKKATSPTIEEAARDIVIKRSLTKQLAGCVRDLQQELVNADPVVTGGEAVSRVCFCLEAIFIHGLKDNIVKKMSSVFSNNSTEKLPTPDFWPVAMVYSHKDVLAQIAGLNQISTDIGRCRAWLRLALNESLLVSYVEAMIQDPKTLRCYYRQTAYMADREQPDIVKQFLEGLSGYSFGLPVNCAALNCWNTMPLQLAGLLKSAERMEPVMPAYDVAEFFQNEAGQSRRMRSKLSVSSSRVMTSSIAIQASEPPPSESQKLAHSVGCGSDSGVDVAMAGASLPVAAAATCAGASSASEANPDAPPEQTKVIEIKPPSSPKQEGAMASAGSSITAAQVRELLRTLNLDTNEGSAVAAADVSGSPASVPDFDVLDKFPHESRRSFGNVLDPTQGWSSPFEDEYEDVGSPGATADKSDGSDDLEQQSYDSLVLSYTQNINQQVCGTPEMRDLITSAIRPCTESQAAPGNANVKAEDQRSSADSLDDLADFEVVPTERAPDVRTNQLLSLMGHIQQEKGLDQQGYACRGCNCPIGMIYGASSVCSYDGYSYCPECSGNESNVIPARIIHNWDFRKHPVSREAKELLKKYEAEPLLDLRILNPSLYDAVPELAATQVLRSQLGFLRPYLQTCSEAASSALRKLIWPREHLYEHIHLYSTFDLLQVPSGTLQRALEKAIKFARGHVLDCNLCAAKGFICEICRDPAVIYAFDTDATYHCSACFAVHHRTCIEDSGRVCPKCERRRQRKEQEQGMVLCSGADVTADSASVFAS
ncbi:pleckstrin homology domain-containing family M member 1 [Dermacentor silvarum]|uniref:pleckstrin homology domain-containing family M member 1 n=1 Tax=Dermacentor silvarum TaxID=543639 RepID=UPI00189C25D0|nr:pleckstrin homology domain-containing family M member 1 [Dermacentor silvarum]